MHDTKRMHERVINPVIPPFVKVQNRMSDTKWYVKTQNYYLNFTNITNE